MRKTNKNGLPRGAGSMQMQCGSYWLRYRDADGITIQENTHSKNPRVARVMLAERAVERAAKFIVQMSAVINEDTAALTRAGFQRRPDGTWAAPAAGNGRGKGGVGSGPKKAARAGAEVAA